MRKLVSLRIVSSSSSFVTCVNLFQVYHPCSFMHGLSFNLKVFLYLAKITQDTMTSSSNNDVVETSNYLFPRNKNCSWAIVCASCAVILPNARGFAVHVVIKRTTTRGA